MNTNKLALKSILKDTEKDKLLFNHTYWEKNALKYKTDYSVSWGDFNMIRLEIKNILKYIKDKDYIIDAGCSNGFSTFQIASNKEVSIRAFDYSKQSIDYALKAQKKNKIKNVSFYHGNILNIEEKDNAFDKAYTIRVLINLLTQKLQEQAILEIHRVLKPGGLYLVSEAFVGGLKNINRLRKLAGFSLLKMPRFNLYLNEKKFINFATKYFNIIEIKHFSSIYYVASRFLRYLTMTNTDKDTFINKINNLFAEYEETENSGDFGIQKLYILRKR